MLTSSHIILPVYIAYPWLRNFREVQAVAFGGFLPDMEILFWFFWYVVTLVTNVNPWKMDLQQLLFGNGIASHYWYWTYATNSILVVCILAVAGCLLFPRCRRMALCLSGSMAFHACMDAFTHTRGNALLWPLVSEKIWGGFDFVALPKGLIVLEQAFMALLAVVCFRHWRLQRHGSAN